MRRIVLLCTALLVFVVPPAFAQNSLPPWATVDNQGQITFNPNGLTPTGAIMLPPPPGYGSVQIDLGNGKTFCLGCLTFNTYAAADGSAVIIPTNYAAVVMAEAQYNPFNQPVESYLGNTLLSWFAQTGDFDPADTRSGSIFSSSGGADSIGLSRAQALSASVAHGLGAGLVPSLGFSKTFQGIDYVAKMVHDALLQQYRLLETMTLEGGVFADSTYLIDSPEARATLKGLIAQAFHGVEEVATPVHVLDLAPDEDKYIRLHASAIGADHLPVIVYLELSHYYLKVAHCQNLACTSATNLILDTTPGIYTGHRSAISIGSDGKPFIIYYSYFGGLSQGGAYTVHGTSGQPDAGTLNGGAYTLSGGFWGGLVSRPYDRPFAENSGGIANFLISSGHEP